MASFEEIQEILSIGIPGADSLRDDVGIAWAVAAETIISSNDSSAPFDQTAGAHDKRILWAMQFLASPISVRNTVFIIVVAANASATQTQILQATDTAIQNNVNSSIDALAANLV